MNLKAVHGLVAAAVSAAVFAEHELVGRRLKRYEIMRITLGVLTVLLLARLAHEADDGADPWSLVAVGFAAGGAARAVCEVTDASQRRERLQHVRRELEEAAVQGK